MELSPFFHFRLLLPSPRLLVNSSRRRGDEVGGCVKGE